MKGTIADRVLDYMAEHDSCHVGALSETLGITKAQASSSLASLVSQGFLRKTDETIDLGGRIPANIYVSCEPPPADTSAIVQVALANRPELARVWS